MRSQRSPKSEAGFALPTVLIAILIAFALGTVGLVGALAAQTGSARDESSKEALAAAESGVNEALLHYNRIISNYALPCVTGSPAAPAVRTNPLDQASWCAQVGPRSLPGVSEASYKYWARPTSTQIGAPPDAVQIVSEGTVDGVSRTIEVNARSSAGLQPFSGSAGVIGLDFITMNSNAIIGRRRRHERQHHDELERGDPLRLRAHRRGSPGDHELERRVRLPDAGAGHPLAAAREPGRCPDQQLERADRQSQTRWPAPRTPGTRRRES